MLNQISNPNETPIDSIRSDFALAMGVETLHLYTWEARDFYSALGWNTVEVFSQDGEPTVLMSRKLGS
ncbi:hypothetical protein LGH82_25190 [Mesorhizobium sp. PAMC28654]|uniref:hypothetical protein n=1 Tax=Mesorhizobium sp. PAMC28654 TaxID=2880934 RepID=UPI001D09BA84|nr:hypothetical protein [Mesorhizobium sp. PAMC28654]UDL88398.1 hypothetical protein LGH82_25190 [Mesorhizobium sp. PAMC28654]